MLVLDVGVKRQNRKMKIYH